MLLVWLQVLFDKLRNKMDKFLKMKREKTKGLNERRLAWKAKITKKISLDEA